MPPRKEGLTTRKYDQVMDAIVYGRPEQTVALLAKLSVSASLRAEVADMAATACFKFVKDGQHVRAAAVALAFNMPHLAEEVLIQGFEAHTEPDDPHRVELAKIAEVVVELV